MYLNMNIYDTIHRHMLAVGLAANVLFAPTTEAYAVTAEIGQASIYLQIATAPDNSGGLVFLGILRDQHSERLGSGFFRTVPDALRILGRTAYNREILSYEEHCAWQDKVSDMAQNLLCADYINTTNRVW